MKPCIKTWLLLHLVVAGHLNAQTYFVVRHGFDQALNGPGYDTNRDGIGPEGGLILSSNILYGAAGAGGSGGTGTIFALNTSALQ